jgi:hypothetical protein
MARFVRLATLRFDSEWARGRSGARQIVLDDLVSGLAEIKSLPVDLVVVSEGVESVGQTMAEAEALDHPGPFLQTYREFARNARCFVAGSVRLAEGKTVYNAVVYYGPDGSVAGTYRKTYPTTGEIEEGIAPDIGSALIYSQTHTRTAMDVAREFGLELLDDYMNRARRFGRPHANP